MKDCGHVTERRADATGRRETDRVCSSHKDLTKALESLIGLGKKREETFAWLIRFGRWYLAASWVIVCLAFGFEAWQFSRFDALATNLSRKDVAIQAEISELKGDQRVIFEKLKHHDEMLTNCLNGNRK